MSETSFTARDDGGFDQSEQPVEGDENPHRSERLQPTAPEPAPSKATSSAAKKAKGKKSQEAQEQPEEEIQPEQVEQPR